MKILCSEQDCSTEAKLRGFCQRHYDRARRSGEIAMRPCASRGARMAFLHKHVNAETDDCILWPFALDSDGYGQFSHGGVSMTASRAMCILAHGEPPFAEAQSAHGCTSHACINPNHLRWATVIENHADKQEHGTIAQGERHGRAKLTDDGVRDIRSSSKSLSALARQYGVSPAAVGFARRGKTWGHLDAVV